MQPPTDQSETPVVLREKAARARRLAGQLPGDEASDRLIQLAEELEARAVASEQTSRHG